MNEQGGVHILGIDLAKDIFQAHGVDAQGQVVLRQRLTRAHLPRLFARLAPCTIGMEACGTAHYWARIAQAHGHTVKLMAPQYVKAYVQRNKTDAHDAAAIAEATRRPVVRAVALKTPEQLAWQSVHRYRQRLIRQRTALTNQLRGFLQECGCVAPRGGAALTRLVHTVLAAPAAATVPALTRAVIAQLQAEWTTHNQQLAWCEAQCAQYAAQEPAVRRLETIPGIGRLTATALVAAIGPTAAGFRNGRHLAAFLGLVPRQHASASTARPCGISKRGDPYLRTLLIHGGRAVLGRAARGRTAHDQWAAALRARVGWNRAAVALANKQARIAWALLAHETTYVPVPGRPPCVNEYRSE